MLICFILFSHQFYDRSYGAIWYSRPISIKFNSGPTNMIESSDFDKIKYEIQN